MKPLRSTAPIGHLLNPSTVYVPAVATDIRVTFARAREAQAKRPDRAVSVTPIRSKRRV